MGEINDNTDREFWTKNSLRIATDLQHKIQIINDVLSKDALSADSDIYVKMRILESDVDELFDIMTNR